MAFVVRRPKGRWEIRESRATDAGPRARTLATFGVLTDDVLAQAERASRRGFNRSAVIASARRAGAPVAESSADAAARALLAEFRAGSAPTPGLLRLLRDRIEELPAPRLESGGSIADWAGASDADRGDALRDLLELTDRLPAPRRTRLRFPGLRAVPAHA
jgi:hypothetical protein